MHAPGPRAGPKKPKTAEELDKELDAFMGDSAPVPSSSTDAITAGAATAGEGVRDGGAVPQDVEMA